MCCIVCIFLSIVGFFFIQFEALGMDTRRFHCHLFSLSLSISVSVSIPAACLVLFRILAWHKGKLLYLDCNKVKVCLDVVCIVCYSNAMQKWIPLLHSRRFNLKLFVYNPLSERRSPHPADSQLDFISLLTFSAAHCNSFNTFSKYKHNLNCIDTISDSFFSIHG